MFTFLTETEAQVLVAGVAILAFAMGGIFGYGMCVWRAFIVPAKCPQVKAAQFDAVNIKYANFEESYKERRERIAVSLLSASIAGNGDLDISDSIEFADNFIKELDKC